MIALADFVEFNLGRGHPLWSDPKVRELGAAMTQVVFGKQPSHISGAIEAAGATPRDLVTNTYSAVPLVSTNSETAALLDYASDQAELDIMPPREPVTQLSEFQSKQLGRSMSALASLDEALKGNDDADGHTVAYMLAYSTLVNNPLGVEVRTVPSNPALSRLHPFCSHLPRFVDSRLPAPLLAATRGGGYRNGRLARRAGTRGRFQRRRGR